MNNDNSPLIRCNYWLYRILIGAIVTVTPIFCVGVVTGFGVEVFGLNSELGFYIPFISFYKSMAMLYNTMYNDIN